MAPEQRLIDANADVGNEVTKIKTHHARIVVDGTADKPYYSIEWYDPAKKVYYLGYSSYNIEFVFNWLSECFEIVDDPTIDTAEVVRCKKCAHCTVTSDGMVCDRALPTKRMEDYYIYGSTVLARVAPDDFCSHGERRTDHV